MPTDARAGPNPRRRRRLAVLLVAVSLGVLADQLVHFLVLRDGWVAGVRIAPFDPPLFSSVQIEAVQRMKRELEEGPPPGRPIRFDAELGWCHAPSSGSGEDRFDELGGRIAGQPSHHARRPGARRILVFGCSFSYGTEVGALDTWPAQLACLRSDLEVVNLAVPGYGLDQAFLRWRRDGKHLDADEVWLGVLPAASTRVVNLYRPALNHWSVTVAFKPRMRLGADDELTTVPHPARSLEDLLRLTADASAFVEAVGDDDRFVARARIAYLPRGSHWTHHAALGRIALTLFDRIGRDPCTALTDVDGEVFAVTRAIARSMAREVAANGQRFRALVLPGRDDLSRADADGVAPWHALVEAWRGDGLEVLDLTDTLRARGAQDDAALWAAGGHYSPVANAAIAAKLAER